MEVFNNKQKSDPLFPLDFLSHLPKHFGIVVPRKMPVNIRPMGLGTTVPKVLHLVSDWLASQITRKKGRKSKFFTKHL